MRDDVVEFTLRFETPVTREDLREEFERRAEALVEPDDEESITVEWTGSHCRRRLRFECRDEGGFERIEERRDGGEWHPLGREIVAGLVVEDNTDAATDRAAEVFRGP